MNAGSRNEGSMGFEMNYLTKVSYSHQSVKRRIGLLRVSEGSFVNCIDKKENLKK